MHPTAPADRTSGRRLLRLDLGGTALFTAVVTAAAVGGERALQVSVAVVSLALFAAGIALSLWAYASALDRSRRDEIGVANLFLLTGPTAPAAVRRTCLGALAAQTVVAVVGATAGLAAIDGTELNALAFGVLVPMFGIGVNGAWAARYGAFGPRHDPSSRPTHRRVD